MDRNMHKRGAIRIGRTLVLPLAFVCGAATAAPLVPLPAAPTAQPNAVTPGLAPAPASIGALPAMPGASTAAPASFGTSDASMLPGLAGVGADPGVASAQKYPGPRSSIRPIRMPGIIPLPLPTLP
jgi:hypothetical protein